jgi:hypothetical protein
MPRIRTTKPEFWVSEQVTSCSPLARLLFIGLWNFCDDGGVHPAEYRRLKSEVFPSDNFTIDEMKILIKELITAGLLYEYVVESKSYWIVTGWRHQLINRPTPLKYPQPDSQKNEINQVSLTTQEVINESSLANHENYCGKGKDGIGKEKDICEVKTSLVDIPEINTSASKKELFNYWQEKMNHPRAKLDKKRGNVIKNALQLGYSVVDLKQAIDGCAKTQFNMGQNDKRQVYDDISLILRDSEHIERFINNETNLSNETTGGGNGGKNIMSGVL